MSSIVIKRFAVMASVSLSIGWSCSVLAAKVDDEAAVVAKLYKDFAWQAMASHADLFGDDLSHQDKATLEKYFSPALADLLVKDAACQTRHQGICNLDFDLLFDSQDPRVTDLSVTTTSPGRVSVVYKDPVDEKKMQIDFEVARVGEAWKITDVIYKRPDRMSLRRILSRKAAAQSSRLAPKEHPWVRIVYFNDDEVQKALGRSRVTTVAGHNDHFHVELWPRYAS
jgi:hypothetical protein